MRINVNYIDTISDVFLEAYQMGRENALKIMEAEDDQDE